MVQALAQANLDEVMEVWSDLGYITRPKSLLEGAWLVQTKLGGRFPNRTLELQQLPGCY